MAQDGVASSHRRLEGKVAIITGGSSGIGEASARLFVSHGAFVLIADIQDELGLRVAHELGANAAFKHCDVTVEADVEAAVAMAVNMWGKLDVMFCNAGTVGKGREALSMKDVEMTGFDRVIRVNVRGTALSMKHGAKAMVEGGNTKGSIICTASVASVMGCSGALDYTASKHAIVGLMRAAVRDLGKHGIRVNCVSPAAIVTPLVLNFLREFLGDVDDAGVKAAVGEEGKILAYHSLTTLDVANAALFLASDESSFVTGLNLVIDGGLTVTCNPLN